MSSKIEIINLALQKLGIAQVVSTEEETTEATAIALAFEPRVRAELQSHPWVFAKERVVLAVDTTAPAFGYSYRYLLPTDFIRLVRDKESDYEFEGKYLLTDESSKIELLYIKYISDPEIFSPLFVQSLAYGLAIDLCKTLVDSTTDLETLEALYERNITAARKANAFDKGASVRPDGDWLESRI